jgi:hypothetical protein
MAVKHGKPSVLGIVTGAVAGLVAITPASGTAVRWARCLIGFAAAFICFLASTMKKASATTTRWTPSACATASAVSSVQTKGVLFTIVYSSVQSLMS